MELTAQTIEEYMETVEDSRKEDLLTLIQLGKECTGKEPKMWGSIIGFGNLHYKYASGREGDMPAFGIANRKQALTLYISYTLETYPELEQLGRYKVGKSCLYIKKLKDVDLDVLKTMIVKGVEEVYGYSMITDNEV